jgi:hypothetical protein
MRMGKTTSDGSERLYGACRGLKTNYERKDGMEKVRMCGKCGLRPSFRASTTWCRECKNEYEKAWRKTPKGKARAKEEMKRYLGSEKGKEAIRRYRSSPLGKLTMKMVTLRAKVEEAKTDEERREIRKILADLVEERERMKKGER